MKQKTNKLQTKDLVTIGIFTALYMVVFAILDVLGGLGPLVWVFMPAFTALFSGSIYMTLARKVQKFGVPLLMGLIPAIIFCIRASYYVVLIATALIAGLIGEWIRKSFGYDSKKGDFLSYIVFSLGAVGNLLPVWIFRQDFLHNMIVRGMPEDYVQAMEAVTTHRILFLLFAATFAAAVVGGIFGNKIVKKHLKKAGMVK